MSEETSMLELLNERLEKEDIVKLVCDYDNKFNKLEENNNQLKSQLQQKDKEIERLNNIINELEEWLYDNTNYEEYDRVEKDTFNYVIKKIEELRNEEK